MSSAAAPARAARRSRGAQAGMAMAVAMLAMAGAAAIQAVHFLATFGVSERTDAFFAAFALYTVFGVFAQSLRVTSVPLLVGDGRRMSGAEFAAALAVIAVPLLVACEPLAPALAAALAPGVETGIRALTVDALRILGLAMALHLAGAGAATLLGIQGRFGTVARAYIAGALCGLAAYFGASPVTGELALAWSMLAGGAVTAAGTVGPLLARRGLPGRPRTVTPRRLVRDALTILARPFAYFVVNGLFLFTLALMSRRGAGDATVLSYAYFYVSYVVAGTSVAVGISRVPDMARGAGREWSDLMADTVPHGFRYAMLVAAPAVAGLVAAGAHLLGELLPGSLGPADVAALERFTALLGGWVIAASLVNFVLPAMFALGRAALVNCLAVAMVALHVAITLAAQRVGGTDGVVAAMVAAPLAFAAVLLAAGGGARRGAAAKQIALDAVCFPALAAVAFAAGLALGALAGGGLGGAVITAGAGAAVYVGLLRLAAPRQLAVLLGSRGGGPLETRHA